MNDLYLCLQIEHGPKWVNGVLLGVVILAAGIGGLCIWLFFKLVKGTTSDVDVGSAHRWTVNASGPILGLFPIVLALAVLGAPLGLGFYLYTKFGEYYSVSTDARAKDSLSAIRSSVLSDDTRSRVSVKIAESLHEFPIRGGLYGKCVSDLFAAICGLYTEQLECITSVSDRSVTIMPRQK